MKLAYVKGYKFQNFVCSLFSKEDFTFIRITSYHEGLYVEDNSFPDLTLRHEESGLQFDIECKFRSDLNGVFKLKKDVFENYVDYETITGRPIFVALGVGLSEDQENFIVPKNLYIIPLRCFSASGSVTLSEKFKHPIDKPFVIKPFCIF